MGQVQTAGEIQGGIQAALIVRSHIDAYLRTKFYDVEGYMNRLDAFVFRELLVGQVKSGISGSLAEIGVHYGRSFFILAAARSGAEKSLGMDLFEDDALYKNPQGIGRLEGFNLHSRKLGFAFSDGEILKGSSLELQPADILSRVGPVRFFSIDGGHMYEHVANDLALAEKVMVEGGIISVDDILTPFWPEVPIATFDWLRSTSSQFVPFLITKEKLYFCHRASASLYLSLLDADQSLKSSRVRSITLLGHAVAVLFPTSSATRAERFKNALVSIRKRLTRKARPKS